LNPALPFTHNEAPSWDSRAPLSGETGHQYQENDTFQQNDRIVWISLGPLRNNPIQGERKRQTS
jgi:hypothetical protein